MSSTLALALFTITLSVTAQFLFKAGVIAIREGDRPSVLFAAISSPHLIAGFALYGFGALLWLRVLDQWDVSKAYPLVGLGFALTVAVGWITGESVGSVRLAGAGLIVLGVFVISQS